MRTESNLCFPEDLREWMDEPALVLEVRQAAAELSRGWAISNEQSDSLETVFRVLGFCYATGCYSSEDAADSCYSDTTLKALCDGEVFPEAPALRAFRRAHHVQVHSLLCRLLHLAVENVGRDLNSDRVWKDVECEAQRRLEMAMLADTSHLDV